MGYLRKINFSPTRLEFSLWAIGALFWVWFVTWGNPTYMAYDWPLMHQIPAVLKQALAEGRIPFYAAYFPEELKFGFWHGGDQVLADPQMLVSPQALLLLWISVKGFIVFQLLMLYTLGYAGLCALARKIKMSDFSLILAFLMYSFGGYFTSKIAVGHLLDGGFFLWAWVIFLSWQIFEEPGARWREMCWLAVVMAFVLIQGNMHIFFHMLMFAGLCVLFNFRTCLNFTSSIIISIILGAYRLIPISLVSGYAQGDRVAYAGIHDFQLDMLYKTPQGIWGWIVRIYSWVSGLAEGLVAIRGPRYLNGGSWWEHDTFLGLAGLIIIIIGLFWLIHKNWNPSWKRAENKLFAAGAVFLILSMGTIYGFIVNRLIVPLGLPVAERLPSRLIVVPLMLAIVAGAHGFGQWLNTIEIKWRRPVMVFAVVTLLLGLVAHAYLWQVHEVEKTYVASDRGETLSKLTFKAILIDKPVEPKYFKAIVWSAEFSLIAWLFVFGYIYASRTDTKTEKT